MNTRIEAKDICSICGDLWCHVDHEFVIVFGSALWSDHPGDIDILHSNNVPPDKARRLADAWASKRGLTAPIELHKGRTATIWSPRHAVRYEILFGDPRWIPTMRDWNSRQQALPLLSSLLRRYPWYGWETHECAMVLDTPEDRQQVAIGLGVAGMDKVPWQTYLNGTGHPPAGMKLGEGWLVPVG